MRENRDAEDDHVIGHDVHQLSRDLWKNNKNLSKKELKSLISTITLNSKHEQQHILPSRFNKFRKVR